MVYADFVSNMHVIHPVVGCSVMEMREKREIRLTFYFAIRFVIVQSCISSSPLEDASHSG